MADPYVQLFNSDLDKDTDASLVAEFYWSTISRYTILVLDQTAAKNILGEPTAEPSYSETDAIPVHMKLDPEEEWLIKFGYDRTRDAACFFSSKILADASLSPKVGDRINFSFTNEAGGSVVEHFIIMEISPESFVRQKGYPFQVAAALKRTHKKKVTP